MFKLIQRLFRKGQKTDVKPLDVWFKGPLMILRLHCPWITPNHITASRILLLLVTISMLMENAEKFTAVVVVLRILDGYTDVADGVWARLFGHGKHYLLWWSRLDRFLQQALGPPPLFGKFFDQASDKICHWVFVGYLLWGIPIRPMMDARIGGVQLFQAVLVLGLTLDATNLLLRIRDYRKPEMANGRASSAMGKAKTWCYSFGGVFLALSYAWNQSQGQVPWHLWTVFCGVISWGLASCLLPQEKTAHGWRQPLWRTLAISGLGVIVVINEWPEGRAFVHRFGQAALCAGVLLGIASTWRQIFPGPEPAETSASRLITERDASEKPTKE